MFRSLKITLEMIKIEHTLFALPFAFLGAVLAANGLPTGRQILWIIVTMVGARSAAMAFNRLVDRRFDAANPRTATRAIPAGLLSVQFVAFFTIVSAALFFLAAAMLNRLTLLLAPVALFSVLFYSYTKRFTSSPLSTPMDSGFNTLRSKAARWGPIVRGVLPYSTIQNTASP